ncbi:MAG: SulP family inorganic anion transporter [Bacteroidota bacterium]
MKNQQFREVPKDGLAGLKQNFGADALSGFLVFLIALPLCLAISKASTGDYSALTGVITAIVGGIVVSFLMGGRLTIKGPAAGLITIIYAAVTELGGGDKPEQLAQGYHLMLAVVVIAAIIQIIFGLIKAGVLGDFFPNSAVHGMLAAIGLIIISKQIHIIFGVKPTGKSPFALFGEIPHSVANMNPYITIIGFVALAILIIMPLIKNKYVKMVPAPLVAVIVSIILGQAFHLNTPHSYIIGDNTFEIIPKNFLVNLPGNVLSAVTMPDWSGLNNPITWKFVAMFALVGTLESMLTVKAMDGLDPFKRKSDMNRDVLALGTGNLVSGMLGGLPMIAEVVRSSANIANGARTRWANFFHGAFLLIFVLAFPGVIKMIPNSALAAMLVFTGYRLASPLAFVKTYKIGKEQLAIFIITIVVTLATDLLLGIAAGILVKFVLHLLAGAKFSELFRSRVEVTESENTTVIKFLDPAIFSNYLSVKKYFDAVKPGRTVVLDFSRSALVDHTFMEHVHRFEISQHDSGGSVEIRGFEHHNSSSSHLLARRTLSPAVRMNKANSNSAKATR